MKKFHCKLLLSLLLLGNFVFAADNDKQEKAGIIVARRGDVTLTSAKREKHKPAIKEVVHQGDIIQTGKRGRAQICFEDDSLVCIGANTTLEITKFFFDPSAQKGAMAINIKEGFFRVLGGAITKIAPENFKAQAGTASIGIRGCSLGGQVVLGKQAVIVFYGSNIGGAISITAGGVTRLLNLPGTGTIIPFGKPPTPPQPMQQFAAVVLRKSNGGGESGNGEPPSAPTPPAGDDDIPTPDPQEKLEDSLLEEANLPGKIMLNGSTIGRETPTGWLYKAGHPTMLSLEIATTGNSLNEILSGDMAISLHAPINDSRERSDDAQLFLPLLFFDIKDGEFSNGYNENGELAAIVTESRIVALNEEKDYMNWGEWEMTIMDPNGETEVTRNVRGLWTATDLPATDLEALTVNDLPVLGGNFVGTYSGNAHCIRNNESTILNGSSAFSLDFRAQTFTGTFDFGADGPTITSGGSITENGIQGNITDVSDEQVDQNASLIEGTLYDSGQVLGTIWNAETDTNTYTGVSDSHGTITPTNP